MRLRPNAVLLLACFGLLTIAGCQPPSQPPSKPAVAPTPLHPDTRLRAHWTGKHTLGVAANAYSLMRLWELPESQQLQSCFLARLAVATFGGEPSASGTLTPNPVLMLLLDDLVDREWFLELRGSSNQPPQFVFAIRCGSSRTQLWRNNLAGAFSSASGVHPTVQADGWTLKHPRTQQRIEARQLSDWLVVGAGEDQNTLLGETMERIRRDGAPAGWQQAEAWLEVDADLAWAAGQLQVPGGGRLPAAKLALALTGDGAHAVTRATLSFANPLEIQLDPWRLPAGLVKSPVVGFTAVRGLDRVLASPSLGQALAAAGAPNQLFVWADAAAPTHLQFASPLPASLDLAPAFSNWIESGNGWLKQNGLGQLAALPDCPGLAWQGLPVFNPALGVSTVDSTRWLVGSLQSGAPAAEVPQPVYPRPSWESLAADVLSRSNLVAYSWETTGARAESLYLMSQVSRVARLHPQLPAEAPSAQWIQSARLRLGNATTWVSLTSPTQLTLERRSSVGFTAAELHLLSDWIESPDFPRGLYSTRTRRAASAAEFQAQ